MSTRNTPHRTTCERLDPAASRMAAMFFSVCSVWASTSAAISPVAGLRPACPDTKTRLPTAMPGEYGPTGDGRFAAVTRLSGVVIRSCYGTGRPSRESQFARALQMLPAENEADRRGQVTQMDRTKG